MKELAVHFDTLEHYVEIDTFVKSAFAAQKAANGFSGQYFGSRLEIDVVVLPPEPGSLLQKLGIKISSPLSTAAALWFAVQVMDSHTVQDVSIELFGQTPTEMLVMAIQGTKTKWSELEELTEEQIQEIIDFLEELIARSTEKSLEMGRDIIERSNIPEQLKLDLEEAQSELYRAAYDNPAIRGIGFSEGDKFPIKRGEFAQRAAKPRRKKEPDEQSVWNVFIDTLLVSSPNFDRHDQAYRKWKAKASNGAFVLFEIVDDHFWEMLKSKEIEFGETTYIVVQIAVERVGGREKGRRVLKVLEVGDKKLSPPLTDQAIRSEIGNFFPTLEDPKQDGLF
ncbi:MAG: hypothetical protein P8L68_00640 [Paracoccaceae bacterium]|nr:hypothetical protein [Paracoccaceae bacterium]MDG2256989.1 hypothetical protein [Paracoccaceae bacterium]